MRKQIIPSHNGVKILWFKSSWMQASQFGPLLADPQSLYVWERISEQKHATRMTMYAPAWPPSIQWNLVERWLQWGRWQAKRAWWTNFLCLGCATIFYPTASCKEATPVRPLRDSGRTSKTLGWFIVRRKQLNLLFCTIIVDDFLATQPKKRSLSHPDIKKREPN